MEERWIGPYTIHSVAEKGLYTSWRKRERPFKNSYKPVQYKKNIMNKTFVNSYTEVLFSFKITTIPR